MKKFFAPIVILILLLFTGVALVKICYGGGITFKDRSTASLLAASSAQRLVSLDWPPGNVAVSADKRVFFNYHPFAKADRFTNATMFELIDGKPSPYPDLAYQKHYQGVFGMTVDRQNRLWLIEPASLDHPQTVLLGFDLGTNRQILEFRFPPKTAQFAQDLRVSPDGRTIYLADTGLFKFIKPGLVVFDLASKSFRVLLRDDPTAQAEDWVIRTPLGEHKLAWGLVNFTVGIDGIELSRDGKWLYYGAMSNHELYRVPTAALLDPRLTSGQLHEQIQAAGMKPLSDGITIDAEGNILLTDIEHSGIAQLTQDGHLQTLLKKPGVIWADGIAVMPDNSIIFNDSAIPAYVDQLARPPRKEKLEAGRPYSVWKICPLK